jgi:hypothetical protein
METVLHHNHNHNNIASTHTYLHHLQTKLTNTGRSPHAQNPQERVFARDPEDDPLTAYEEQARARSSFSDEKFAALAVLKSSELLMTYALANKEVCHH